MEIKYEREELLETLRELTKLNQIAIIKLKKAYFTAKKNAIKKNKKNPHTPIEIDYTAIDNIEIQLRMVALAKSLTPLWKRYVSVGEYRSGLSDYIRDYLNNYMDNKYKKNSMTR